MTYKGNVIAMLPLTSKQEREIDRMHKSGITDWNIAFHLEPNDRERREVRLGQIQRILDRDYPNRTKKNLSGA